MERSTCAVTLLPPPILGDRYTTADEQTDAIVRYHHVTRLGNMFAFGRVAFAPMSTLAIGTVVLNSCFFFKRNGLLYVNKCSVPLNIEC